ncbi:M14 family zinc carboxypeptidase [Halalkalicoccus sp. NIPERK01]|uniref:M14 family zinc carboxypeptidase n=1 Tax=Halalkalicoccus sp. NIPERK01 TaxID=3053469 RepID=UPI00256EC915|nr:M14 family zinc carboxypeptidase [Halalkalicoccus sp. NIPERK01]MDL5363347.1 M14 family zinc carboxypeptidase [Halalkalicoccus sp. NIPERK01]
MKQRQVLKSIGGATAVGIAASGRVAAQECPDDFIKPGGPFVPETATINYNAFTSNDELYGTLEQLDARSDLEYEPIGETWQGRDIPYMRAGDGDTDVFYVTQQHGDEQHVTEAVLRLLQWLAAGGRRTDDVLDELTLHVVPRHNPDGWAPADDNETPTRANARPEDVCHDGPYFGPDQCGSVDPNRQHYFGIDPDLLADIDGIDPDLIPDENPSPETQAVLDKADEVGADIVTDWHHQFTYRNEDCEMVNASTRWPLNEAAPEDAVNLSRQISAYAYQQTEGYGHTTWDLYPGGTTANIARNAHGVRGRGSVLFEFRGQASQLGNASNGRLVTVINNVMTEILEGLASGDLYEVDPADADDIPPRGDYFWKELPRSEWGPEHEAYRE